MKTKHLIGLLCLSWMGAILVSSCEKAILDEEEQTTSTQEQVDNTSKSGKANIVLRVSNFILSDSEDSSTRSVVDLTTYCTRLNFVVYKDGEKVKGLSQKKEDGGFGEVTMSLDPGTYKLLVLAHSSVGGNPVVSDPEKIQFTNALGYSDTFSYYGDLEVTGEAKTHEVMLSRNVSCLRFIINDEFPSNVKYMKFFYTGGSGVLNAVTGYGGNVNSQQEKLVDISSYSTPLTFNLYTFLQQDEALLQLKVTALAEDKKTVIKERPFPDIRLKYRRFSEFEGTFFIDDNGFSISAETDWGEPYEHVDY
mgnify:CR=1 FL=1